MPHPLPASLPSLRSRGIPAVQIGRIIVAIPLLEPDRYHGWTVILGAGIDGRECHLVACTTTAGRTRLRALQAAREVALRYARAIEVGRYPDVATAPDSPRPHNSTPSPLLKCSDMDG